MEVKVIRAFYDRKGGVTREAGSLFTCTEARYKEIESVFPGILEKQVKPKRAPRKKVE